MSEAFVKESNEDGMVPALKIYIIVENIHSSLFLKQKAWQLVSTIFSASNY